MLQDDGLRFDVPAEWADEATLVLAPAERRPGHAITVTRELLADDETIGTHLERLVVALAKHIDDLELLAREDRTLCGRPAVARRVRWRGTMGRIEQFILAVEACREGRRVVYLFAATAPATDAPAMRAAFEAVLRTVTLDETSQVRRVPAPEALRDWCNLMVPMPGVRARR
jgi:hypothetical protein